jgi:hypothetical protein
MTRILVIVAAALLSAAGVAQDEGWAIERFEIRYDIQPDGTVAVQEAIDVDFGGLTRRGIFRDIRNRFGYDETSVRLYPIELIRVTDAAGTPQRVREIDRGNEVRFQIGDPDRTVTGRTTASARR